MSRNNNNHEEFTTIPVNSTMQDMDEIDDFSLVDSENERRYTNYDDDYQTESEFDDYDETTFESKLYTLNTYNEMASRNPRQYLNHSDDLKEMTNITRINNSHKKTLKSFQEKYPMSVELPNVLYYSSSTSLNSYNDDGNSIQRGNPNFNSIQKRPMSKQDLGRIYQELNTIHNKLVVSNHKNNYKKLKIKCKLIE